MALDDIQWRQIVSETARVGAWCYHPAENKLVLSPEVGSLLGVDVTQYQSLESFAKLFGGTHQSILYDLMDDAAAGESISGELSLIQPNPCRWVKLSCRPGDKKTPVIGTLTDITMDKQQSVEREDLLYRIEFAARSAGIGVWDWNIVDDILIWDDQMYSLYGITPDQFSGAVEAWQAGLHPEDKERASGELEAALSGLRQFNTQFRVVHPDSSIHHLRAFALVERNEDGSPVRMVGTNWDITDTREYENALIEAKQFAEQANRAKSDFLASMSHELRTPMNSILGFAQLLEMEPLTEKQHNFSGYILKSGNHLLALIDELLDLARIEAGKMSFSIEAVELSKLVEECLDMVKDSAKKRDITLSQPEPNESIWIQVDRTRMKQALLNFLSNAVKYNRVGGRIWVAWTPKDAETVRIEVHDTGAGIPKHRQADLFQPFNRLGAENTEIEGTGVGLALTRRMIEQMDGTVGAVSTLGKGSCFWSEVPRAYQTQEPVGKEPITEPAFEGKKVLYVEDNPSNLLLMEALVDNIGGLSLVSAHNAAFGLELATSECPDLIILDINLPGMDGVQALGKIQEDPRINSIPVIALSSNAMPNDIKRAMGAGFLEYLTKPINIKNMKEVLQRYLGV